MAKHTLWMITTSITQRDTTRPVLFAAAIAASTLDEICARLVTDGAMVAYRLHFSPKAGDAPRIVENVTPVLLTREGIKTVSPPATGYDVDQASLEEALRRAGVL